VKRFRGGLVFEAHRLLYHSTLGLRVVQKKKKLTNSHHTRTLQLILEEGSASVREILIWRPDGLVPPLYLAHSGRVGQPNYMGTSLIRKRTSLGPYRRPMPRDLW